MSQRLTSEEVTVADSAEAINDLFIEKGWSDGLPIIPPTKEAVERMLTGTKRSASEVVAVVPNLMGEATVEKIAINAVMAGCLPEYMPVIIAAAQAICEESFHLERVQATTHPCSPLLIVNGPIAKKLNINGGSGAFGPCWRANATIGRAVRLIMLNIGGGYPAKMDMSTQGQPSKYCFCVAENEDSSPWEPLHVEKGFDAETSTVTVSAVENPHNINDHDAVTAEELFTTIADTVATMGSNDMLEQGGNPVLALGPEHAATMAKDGFSKSQVKAIIQEKAKIPRKNFHEKVIKRRFPNFNENALMPVIVKQEDLTIIVVGGPGKHSSFMPSFGVHPKTITKAIEKAYQLSNWQMNLK